MTSGYKLADVRPGYARVVRADGSEIGTVHGDERPWSIKGYWVSYLQGHYVATSASPSRRLAVAALVEGDMLARQQEGES